MSFEVGIVMKGLDGVLQTIGGFFLWFLSPATLNQMVQSVLHHWIVPSYLSDRLFDGAQHFATTGKTFAAVYLFSHGLVKIAIVVALWLNKLWAYPLGVIVFTGFIAYQCYRYTYTHSVWLIWLSVFDAIVVYLTWREYQEQKSSHSIARAVAD